eukprot:5959109-Prymnesium_polylepis.1
MSLSPASPTDERNQKRVSDGRSAYGIPIVQRSSQVATNLNTGHESQRLGPETRCPVSYSRNGQSRQRWPQQAKGGRSKASEVAQKQRARQRQPEGAVAGTAAGE